MDQWVVLYCNEDDSHVLVAENTVIYEGSLTVGDVVKFAYPGFKDLLEGEVKGVSGDYKALSKLQDSLNASTKPKREASFHVNEKRKAAKRCRDGLHELTNKKKKRSKSRVSKRSKSKSSSAPAIQGLASSAQSETEPGVLEFLKVDEIPQGSSSQSSILGQVLEGKGCESDEDGSVTDKNDSDSTMESDEDQKQLNMLLKKMASKNKKYDLSMLKELSSQLNPGKSAINFGNNENAESSLALDHETVAQIESSEKKTESKSADNLEKFKEVPSDQLGGKGKQSGSGWKPMGSKHDKSGESSDDSHDNVAQIESSEKKTESKSADNLEKFKEVPSDQPGGKGKQSGSGWKPMGSKHDKSGESSDDSHDNDIKKQKRPAKIKRQNKRRVVEIKFEGESLKWKASDEKVEKLWEDNSAYILEKDLKKAKSSCGNPSQLTRFLTRAIFTKEAREVCSVSGKASLAPSGQDYVEVRTKLNQEGVDAIVAYVDHRGTKKNWKVPPPATIKQYMANVLCEDRAEARIRAEEASKDKQQE